jgi:RND family efflux transporter MFP subunit
MPKKIKFYKKPRYYAIAAILLVGSIACYAYFTKKQVISYETATAVKGELIQEVSVTGRVEPAESVNLSFEISGKVEDIFAKVGDKIQAGQKLISLKDDEILAQLRQAQAGVASAQAQIQQYEAALKNQQAKLDELKQGTRPEEMQLALTALNGAEKAYSDAGTNLDNVKAKAEADLQNVYSSALNILPSAVNTGRSSLVVLSDIQYAHYLDSTDYNTMIIENAKKDAVYALFDVSNAGKWIAQYISTLSSGVYGDVQALNAESTNEKIDATLLEVSSAIQKVKYALNIVPITEKLTDVEKSSLDSMKTLLNSEISNISNSQQTISVQKASSENLIAAAETNVNNAKNSLSSAQDQLKLKRAGYTDEQIKAQEAQVDQAKANLAGQRAMLNQAYANVQNFQAQLSKTILYAPISGLVTKMEAKVGEVVFPSSPYSNNLVTFVSIISDINYQIETDVPEVDIAKIKIGNTAKVTLDAYGDEVGFPAKVISVEPAETIVEGIPTYKVKLQFDEQDERIKSGMTANIDILTDKKENIIIIPQRAIIVKDGEKIVRVAVDNPEEKVTDINEIVVETGLRGSDGRIEITKGINEGDKVVTFIKNGG